MANLQSTMLDESLPIFIRESLNDQGEHRCENNSPDIVVRKFKFNNPIVELRNTYNTDISTDGDGSGKMYIYVRFKNTSNQPVKDFYIHLYRNHLGLCNDPSDWARYELMTEDRKPAFIKSLEPGEIGVTPAFIYDNKKIGAYPNCFVAVATREKNPEYSSINTFNKYIVWINKTNVAARNVCVRPRSMHRETQSYFFENMRKNSSSMIGFECQLSSDTSLEKRFGLIQKEFGINESKTYIVTDKGANYIFCCARLPKGYRGELQAWFEAFENDSVNIKVNFWDLHEEQSSALLDQYGIDLGERLDGITEMPQTFLKPKRALLLGSCYFKSIT